MAVPETFTSSPSDLRTISAPRSRRHLPAHFGAGAASGAASSSAARGNQPLVSVPVCDLNIEQTRGPSVEFTRTSSPGTRNALSLQAPPADGQPGVRLPGPAMKLSFASVVTTRASETLSCALSQSASAARAKTTKNVRTIADGPARQGICLRLRIDGAPQLAADLVLMLSRLRVPSMQDEAVYPEAMRRSG